MRPGQHRVVTVFSGGMLLAFVTMLLVGLIQTRSVSAQDSAAQQLAEKYSPILMLRQQKSNCDYKGEGFFPTSVDWIWGNPDVTLKAVGTGKASSDPVIKVGPEAADLVNAGPESYLDFKGDPRNPGCTYEQYFKAKAAELGLEPSVYAKFVYSPSEHRLYLEYWYYFYFNDWNDTHESDWEMLAIAFDAETPEEARNLTPSWVGYAQHGGGEEADWDDKKLKRDGDHPIAYLSAGSHATYYSSAMMIGWGENGTAFGCDNTTGPSTEVRPTVILVPDLADPDGPFAWTYFEGRWGERQMAMFNGPGGPNVGVKWNNPAKGFGDWRPDTLTVPSSNTLGVNTTDLFCTLSEKGSRALVMFGSKPWSTSVVFFGILGLIGIAIWRVWPFFMEALDVYGNELRTFLGIGAMAIPIGLLFNGFRVWADEIPPLSWMNQFFDGSDAGSLASSLFVLVFQQIAIILIVTPAIIFAMREIHEGVKPGVWRSLLGGLSRLSDLIPSVVILFVMIVALSWTIFLIPLAIYAVVRFQFFSHAILLDDVTGKTEPLRVSWRISKGKWIHTFMLTLAFQILGLVPGPLIGVIMLIIGGTNVKFANAFSSVLYAIFVPLSAIGICLAYRRLKGEDVYEAHMLTRERDPIRARETDLLREKALQKAIGS